MAEYPLCRLIQNKPSVTPSAEFTVSACPVAYDSPLDLMLNHSHLYELYN